jgi:hypothetical protein
MQFDFRYLQDQMARRMGYEVRNTVHSVWPAGFKKIGKRELSGRPCRRRGGQLILLVILKRIITLEDRRPMRT